MKQKFFLGKFKGRVRFDEPLKERTSLGIGGPARFWVEPENLDDILRIFSFARGENLDIFVIGEGTNLLVRDKGFDGIVVNLRAPYFKRIYRRIRKGFEFIYAGAGVKIEALCRHAQTWCLKGLEFLTGIPGGVGGALIMNAGVNPVRNLAADLSANDISNGVKDFYGRRIEIGDIVWEVSVMDRKGKTKVLKRSDLDFNYRSSNLDGYVILGANFRLEKGEKEDILKKTEYFFEKRNSSQELRFPSAGCIFKNPAPDQPAGLLLERCGLKGKRVGDAQISHLHANFIINLGRASFGDVISLIEIARKKVKEDFGIELELEVRLL